jgi:hypothetical protein
MATPDKNPLATPKPGQPTQRYLDIAEIREDAVVMKDGTLRSVLMVSSINFALKSEDEQQAIIQGYMQFLNGLNHPIQICIQSRKMNIDNYLLRLKEQEEAIRNELLKTQIRGYMSFIKELVDLGDIMQKRFYVVVPYDAMAEGKKARGFLERVSTALSPAKIIKLNAKQFNDRRTALMQRAYGVAGGLQSLGLQVVQLDTQGLIELYYTSYNPEVLDSQKLVAVEDLQLEKMF